MLFLLLAGISVLLAVVQGRSRSARDPAAIRTALIRGGSAFVAGWLLEAVASRIGGDAAQRTQTVHLVYAVQSALLALLGLLLWSSLARLVFYRFEKRDLLWIVPFGTLSILAGTGTHVIPVTAALLGWPVVARVRWRREAGSGTQALVALLGFLLILPTVVSVQMRPAPDAFILKLSWMERYAHWVRALAGLHLLVALPRLLWGMNLPVRSVKRRLMVSHLLTGLVPISLVLVFWGLSTYLSVNGERARIAARFVTEDARDLGRSLDAALPDGPAQPGPPADRAATLASWARIQAAICPGLRVWMRSPGTTTEAADGAPEGISGGPALVRVFGDSIPGETALAAWPDSGATEGVFLLAGRSYVGAVRRAPESAAPAVAVLVPTSSVLGLNLKRKLDAETYLETRYLVEQGAGGLTIATTGGDTLTDGSVPSPRAAPGAATLSAMEWSDGVWHRRIVLLWARVGFISALRGLARNLQENPFNLIPLVFLAVVALLFVLVEVVTIGMVTTMGKSILRALDALRQGTSRLRSGNLRYRIPVEGSDDLWNVAESFNEMAADLDKARALEMENERIEGELSLARRIQARLLPGEVPTVACTELAGLYMPARQVGGDYYDFLPMGPDRIGLLVADVSGKGVPAALLMSSFRAALLSQDLEGKGPAPVLVSLNSFLNRSIEPGRFVTAFLAVLTPSTGQLVYANAGHNPPVLLHPGGEVQFLKQGGLVLGLFGESAYQQTTVQLDPGDLVMLYTDGVTEAQNEEEEFWGEERLIDLLRGSREEPCRRILRVILNEVRSFSGDLGQTDDITMVAARWRGEVPASA